MDTKSKIAKILNSIFLNNVSNYDLLYEKEYFNSSFKDSYLSKNKDTYCLVTKHDCGYDAPKNNISELVKMNFSLPSPNLNDKEMTALSPKKEEAKRPERISELISKNFQLPKVFNVKNGISEFLNKENEI